MNRERLTILVCLWWTKAGLLTAAERAADAALDHVSKLRLEGADDAAIAEAGEAYRKAEEALGDAMSAEAELMDRLCAAGRPVVVRHPAGVTLFDRRSWTRGVEFFDLQLPPTPPPIYIAPEPYSLHAPTCEGWWARKAKLEDPTASLFWVVGDVAYVAEFDPEAGLYSHYTRGYDGGMRAGGHFRASSMGGFWAKLDLPRSPKEPPAKAPEGGAS